MKDWSFAVLLIIGLIVLWILVSFTANSRPSSSKVNGMRIAVIDGCEYIHYYGKTPVHKGNCTNEIHKVNQ